MPAHMNIQFQHHDTKTDTKLQLPRGCCSIPELRLFEAPSYTLHAPAIIRVVGCAATCDCIVCGHLSTSKGIKVHVNIVAQDLLAKYHVTYTSNTWMDADVEKFWADKKLEGICHTNQECCDFLRLRESTSNTCPEMHPTKAWKFYEVEPFGCGTCWSWTSVQNIGKLESTNIEIENLQSFDTSSGRFLIAMSSSLQLLGKYGKFVSHLLTATGTHSVFQSFHWVDGFPQMDGFNL